MDEFTKSYITTLQIIFVFTSMLFFLSIPLNISWANGQITSSNYLGGSQFCEKYKQISQNEFSKRIYVPKDYTNPKGAKITIYSWFVKKYDSKKPTLIFVDGGPGGNSHLDKEYSDKFNILHFDQRGVACSRPAHYADYMDPNFYSTYNNIEDMKRVLDSYKFGTSKQVSIYAVSYGTVLATQFMHNYPQYVKAAILEGTYYSVAEENRVNQTSLLREMQNFFDILPDDVKGYFSEKFTEPSISLPDRLIYSRYSDLGWQKLRKELIVEAKKSIQTNNMSSVGVKPKAVDVNDLYEFDSPALQIINCKELTHSMDYYVIKFSNGKFEVSTHEENNNICHKYKVDMTQARVPYDASRYTTNIMITYFQGQNDAATYSAGAIKHWKTVVQDRAQLFIKRNGGHGPNYVILNYEQANPNLKEKQRIIFEKALLGEFINSQDLEEVNKYSHKETQWVYTKKIEGIVQK